MKKEIFAFGLAESEVDEMIESLLENSCDDNSEISQEGCTLSFEEAWSCGAENMKKSGFTKVFAEVFWEDDPPLTKH